jgi:hypothetical protein
MYLYAWIININYLRLVFVWKENICLTRNVGSSGGRGQVYASQMLYNADMK